MDIADNKGETPLMLAVKRGNFLKWMRISTKIEETFAYDYSGRKNMAEFLIKKGANVNLGDRDGWMPLHLAALKGIF